VLTDAFLPAQPNGAARPPREYQQPPTDTHRSLAGILADLLGVERVPVHSNFFDDLGADSLMMAQFCARVRKRPDLPSVSMKDVYQHPSIAALVTALAPAAPVDPVGGQLAKVLAGLLQVDVVPVDSHFFDDLGADSLMMAQFCARVRKRPDLPSVSMKDVYQHPTMSSLVAALAPAEAALPPIKESVPEPAEVSTSSIEAPARASSLEYVLCGTLQVLVFLGYSYLVAAVLVPGYDWISDGSGVIDDYVRSVLVGGAVFLGSCIFPILAKWILIGRWKPQQIRIWSLAYVRFWTVKTLVRANPLVLFFTGSPLYVLYLRLLGAKIGRGVVIFSRHVPVCTDLLTIGDGTVIRKEVFLSGYRAHAGLIQTGRVTLGKNVYLSEATVLDIETSLGDGAQLGHRSALYTGQAVPAGQRWHGSPGRQTEVDYRMVEPTNCRTRRRAAYSMLQLLTVLAVTVPLMIGGVTILLAVFPRVAALLDTGAEALTSWWFYGDALAVASVLFFGSVLVGLLVAFSVPRVLNLFVKPDAVYPLYGFHYSVHRAITRLTNIKFHPAVFGDSSYIVNYLRGLGYDLGRVEQTGSNFGCTVKHENPYLVSVGRGTMVADGLSMINADYSSTSFRVSQVSIGARNFLGNHITYPAQGRTGDNCLLATKVLVPIDGKIREGVGLLGSPSFEIPRTVERDGAFDHLRSEGELGRHLAAKNKYNRHTMGVYLLVRWINLVGVTLITLVGVELHDQYGAVTVALATVLSVFFSIAYGMFVERVVMKFRSLSPQFCSIYDPYFWWHERLWKLLAHPVIFNGTPFKSVIWRLLGVRIGSRVFDDGCHLPERTLVTIGDDVTLNAGTEIQGHSQEDGAFKSDYITIGTGCTLGVGALVHYGVTMGDGVVLAPDSFLMKGEEVPPHARWGGNPAAPMRNDHRTDNAGAALGGATTPIGSPPARPRGRHRAQPVGRHRPPAEVPGNDNRPANMVGTR